MTEENKFTQVIPGVAQNQINETSEEKSARENREMIAGYRAYYHGDSGNAAPDFFKAKNKKA